MRVIVQQKMPLHIQTAETYADWLYIIYAMHSGMALKHNVLLLIKKKITTNGKHLHANFCKHTGINHQ